MRQKIGCPYCGAEIEAQRKIRCASCEAIICEYCAELHEEQDDWYCLDCMLGEKKNDN